MWTEKKIIDLIHEVCGTDFEIDVNEKLVRYAISSLQIMKIVGRLRKCGKKVTFADLMENQTVSAWHNLLCDEDEKENEEENEKNFSLDDHDPFELTDVQYAYLIGRENEQPMGGVDCHAYYEFEGNDIDVEKLKGAWEKLNEIHAALRTVFQNGMQKVTDKIYPDTFKVHHFHGASAKEDFLKLREELSHRQLDIENGETAGLNLCLFDDYNIVCLDFALIVADVKSIQILLRDLAKLYCGEELASDNWNNRNFIERNKSERAEEEKKAEAYWKNHVDSMPLRPELPLAKKPANISHPRYTHYTDVISSENWEKICSKANASGATAAMALLTAYAQVISRWSTEKKFLINVPLFDRPVNVSGSENAVADFTTLLLTSHNFENTVDFSQKLMETSDNFINDMHYASFSGVKVQRLLQKSHQGERDFAPVVFACNIGLDFVDDQFEKSIGEIGYMVSQTPQVWIDCQLFERKGELHVSWDVCDELFPEGMPQSMFDTYIAYLIKLAVSENWNAVLTPDLPEKSVRKTVAETIAEYPKNSHSLIEGLLRNATENPEKIALRCENVEITYIELYKKSEKLAETLREKGAAGNPVVLKIARGINQIVTIYGILLAGAFYVPCSYNQPLKRIEKVINSVGAKWIVTENTEDFAELSVDAIDVNLALNGWETVTYKEIAVNPDSSAYIIMTSGSTGEPKGVEVSHKSAMNTIIDVCNRNKVEGDFISISAIDFDLSVYDIFASAWLGATLNILNEENAKDADAWLTLMMKNNVKVWNSVPVLADMLFTAIENRKEFPPLKNIMLSGDWVTANLVQKIHRCMPECRIIAMGGATEASIWSNEYIVGEIPDTMVNIPYGKALSGQIYRIVDKNGNDCPDWVSGELFIGGYGVAKCYRNDHEKTAQKFTDENGFRWYHTGDMGRFWSDGTIEFLGRADYQVKVKGHRIELSEIESVMSKHPKIERCVASLAEENGMKYIRFYYTGEEIDKTQLNEYAESLLPKYMVPERWMYLENMPLSSNGKIDRKSLPEIKAEESSNNEDFANDEERKLAEIWKSVLEVNAVSRNSDYFELGGNSLNATRLIYKIKEDFGVKLKISTIFRCSQLSAMALKLK